MHRGQVKFSQVEFVLSLQKAYRQKGRDRKLGELLIEHRVIDAHSLAEALEAQECLPQESITLIINAMKEFPTKLTRVFAD